MKTIRFALRAACFFVITNPGLAETIAWFNNPGKVNLDASGQTMDGQFTFSLGVFSGGFLPDSGNVGGWLAHWVAASSIPYNPVTQRFASQYQVTSNALPFTIGTQGWIFGRREIKGIREWILFRRNTWTWPAPNPINPFPLNWNVETANQVVWGEVNTTGMPYLMKAAIIPTTFEEWRDVFLVAHPEDEPRDDPDRDGVSNLMEFVMGSDPLDRQSRFVIKPSIAAGSIVYEIPRISAHFAEITIELSGNLVTWESGEGQTEIVSETPTKLTVRDLIPIAQSPGKKRFLRLRATLPGQS